MAVLTVDQVLDGSSLGLTSGLSDLLVLDLGGKSILYALSRTENRLIQIGIASDGTLTVDASVTVQGTFPAGSEPLLGHVSSALGDDYLTLAGLPGANGQWVSLSSAGALGTQQIMSGVEVMAAPVSFDAGGVSAMVSGRAGVGLDLFTDNGNDFGWRAGLDDTGDRYLADTSASVAFEQSGANYVATLSATEDGLNIASATSTTLSQAGALGKGEGLPVDLPSDIDVVQRLDETLLFIASLGTNSVSVVRVTGGVPTLGDHILDSEETMFTGASSVSALTYGDFAFVVVGGAEGGVSLLTALPGGRLVHLASFADDDTTSLYRVNVVEMLANGTTLQIYGSSFWETGVTRLGYDLSSLGLVVEADGTGDSASGTNGDDQVIGSDVGEALSGGAGDDIILDGAGSDILTGGAGADLFAMSPDGQADTITDFERGLDKLDLSAFDFLYDISQLGIAPTSDGAILTHGSETITIVTADAQPLTAAELTTDDILNVDRPPLLAIGQELFGGPNADVLIGGMGADIIRGYAGADSLTGGFGDDNLEGGAGSDWLDAGGGNDTLAGQNDADTLIGGSGDDLIFGDGGGDVIYGDEWSG